VDKRLLLAWVVGVVLLTGCEQTPPPASVAPTPRQSFVEAPTASLGRPSATSPVATPSPPATTASPPAAKASVAWHPITFPDGAYVVDLNTGPAGIVALADCPRCGAIPATALWTRHAFDWHEVTLPRAKDIALVSVSSASVGYVIGAIDLDQHDGITEEFLQVWRSEIARTWQRVGEMPLGVQRNGPRVVNDVVLTTTGAILVGKVSHDGAPAPSKGPFITHDAVHWRLVDPSVFGVEAIDVKDLQSIDSELYLIGAPCAECPARVWRSTDGLAWSPLGELGPNVVRATIAVDGDRRVVAVLTCTAPNDCAMEIWSSIEHHAWTLRVRRDDIDWGRVTFGGGAFVFVGNTNGTDYEVLTSVDGIDWFADDPDPPSGDECGVVWLVGAYDGVYFGDPDCGSFRGTVTVD